MKIGGTSERRHLRRAVLINAGGTDNLGDQAIDCALREMLNSRGYHTHSINYASPSRPSAASGHVVRGSGASLARRCLRALLPGWLKWYRKAGRRLVSELKEVPLDEVEVAVVGGGQLILAYPDFKDFIYALAMWVTVLRMRCRCRIIVFGVGAGTDFTGFERLLVAGALRMCHDVVVRDPESQLTVRHCFGIDARRVPDVAFCYSKSWPSNYSEESVQTVLVGIYDYRTFCRVSAEAISRESYFDQWSDRVEGFIARGLSVKLISSEERDLACTREFVRYLSDERGIEVPAIDTCTLPLLEAELARASEVCSARMHALILGILYGCRLHPVIISPKLESFRKLYQADDFCLDRIQSAIRVGLDRALEAPGRNL